MALAAAGADIALITPDVTSGEKLRNRIASTGRKTLALAETPVNESEADDIVQRVLHEFGHIDILVNSTMLDPSNLILETTLDEWQEVIGANLNRAFLFSKTAGNQFVRQGSGKIINIGSGLAVRGQAGKVAFCASMGALYQLTRALAIEWARSGVRVNFVGCGRFEGDDVLPGIANYIPAKRLGQPWEIGGLVAYLASESSDFITGQAIFVDGGLLSRS